MVTRYTACFAALILCTSVNVFAALNSSVNRTVIEQGDTVRLSIDLSGKDENKVDLSSLQAGFTILQRAIQSGATYDNNSFKMSKELILVLAPKQPGDQIIPSITVEGEQTEPHAIRVVKVAQLSASEGGIELLSTLSSKHPKVQQPIVYQASLILGQQIFNATLQEPAIVTGKALIEPLGGQKQYQQNLKGHEVTVVEQAWLITPEQSGPLEISPASLTGQVQTGQMPQRTFSRIFSDPNAMRRVQISGQGYKVEVEGIPASFSGNTWLPAKSIRLVEKWSTDDFAVGEPVTRTITLEAEGVSSHQLSEIVLPEITGIKQYAGTPQIEQRYENDMLTSTLLLDVTMIPGTAGEANIPEVVIPWWNVDQDREDLTALPSRVVDISPGDVVAKESAVSLQPPVISADTHQPSGAVTLDTKALVTGTSNHPDAASSVLDYWWLAALSALVGSGLTYLSMAYFRKRPTLSSRSDSGINTANHEKVIQPSLDRIKTACMNHDALEARVALIEWGKQLWPDSTHLNQLCRKVSPELQQLIADLQRQSYSQPSARATERWNGDALWQAIQSYKPNVSKAEAQVLARLSPVYP